MNIKPGQVLPQNLTVSPRASAYLDAIRGIAAFLVVIGHVRGLFYVPYSQVSAPNGFTKIIYFITSFGHQAVVVFFVLSGFFISSSIFKMHLQNRWSWSDYLAQRLVRLWIVLLPALALTAGWDLLGLNLFGPAIYEGLPADQNILGFSALERLGWPTLIGNILFVQGVAVTPFGSNGPLWSLSYEFWYYIAFPCLLLALFSQTAKTRLGYLAALLALGFFVGGTMVLSFGVWLLGVAVVFLASLGQGREPAKAHLVVGAVPLGICLALSVSKKDVDFSWAVAASFAWLMYLLLRLPASSTEREPVPSVTRLSKSAAGFSYSLYLLHLPPLVFLHAYLHTLQPQKWQPTAQTLLLGLLATVGVTTYAWFISVLTEARTAQLRSFVVRRTKSRVVA